MQNKNSKVFAITVAALVFTAVGTIIAPIIPTFSPTVAAYSTIAMGALTLYLIGLTCTRRYWTGKNSERRFGFVVILVTTSAIILPVTHFAPFRDSSSVTAEEPPNSSRATEDVSSSIAPPLVPPTPDSPPATDMAELAVLNTCMCTGPRNQGQVIVQLRVTNTGPSDLDVAIENVRLLVPEPLMGPWTPNEPVADYSIVTVGEDRYVALPANGNRAWEPEFSTFASHWYADSLTPGQSHSPQGKDSGEVVFYVPHAPDTGVIKVFGVALVTDNGRTVVGWQGTDEWPPSTDPNSF